MNVLNPADVTARWAAALVDELARVGVNRAVIAPGSRSTPLVLAFSAHRGFQITSLLDERGAGYFALGLGMATGKPAALVCTSGTAAANFLPAVIEASEAGVPLLVLTADRPPELRGTGANQTIEQAGLYANFVRFSRDLLPPQPDSPALRYLRTTIDRAVAASRSPRPGPVHLNLPFRKPLEPDAGTPAPPTLHARGDGVAFTDILPAAPQTALPDIEWPARGLVVAGPGCPGGEFPAALASFCRRTGYALVADGLSGLRFGPWTEEIRVLSPQVCAAAPLPELVLQFGAVPTADPVHRFLERLPEGTKRVSVQAHSAWRDDLHTLTHLIHADPADFCARLEAAWDLAPDPGWGAAHEALDDAYWTAVERAEAWFEGLALPQVVESLGEGGLLFVANSLPVRHLDELVRPRPARLRVFGNRGASGIDGTISTALGVAAGAGRPVTLVLGDLAFYHDLNGLLALGRAQVEATIVVLHNDGGGIFRRLPVAAHEPPFRDLFLTPHGLDFEPAARMFGLDFYRAEGGAGLARALQAPEGPGASRLIQVRTDSKAHETARRDILRAFIRETNQKSDQARSIT